MKSLLRVSAVAFLVAASMSCAGQTVDSVPSLDLARYAGRWYEIAAFPMFFQRRCTGDTTAEYAIRPDGEIDVTNRCRTDDGFDEARGSAWAPQAGNFARLKVSFFWPFRSDYWVIGLDPDYRWAVIGQPSRKYLWILARSPQLAKDQLDLALQAAARQGYDLAPLRYTRHGPAPTGESGTREATAPPPPPRQ